MLRPVWQVSEVKHSQAGENWRERGESSWTGRDGTGWIGSISGFLVGQAARFEIELPI